MRRGWNYPAPGVADRNAAARALVDAVRSAGVASVVFFADRFTPEFRTWFASQERGEWPGGGCAGDLVHLTVRHESGATSTVSLAQFAVLAARRRTTSG